MTWMFRGLTLVSVGYLVYDRLYETEATITSAAPNDESPTVFLFSINNNSHIFKITNVEWNCVAEHLTTSPKDMGLINTGRGNGTQKEIMPGQSLNINCNAGRSKPLITMPPDERIAKGIIWITISYETDLIFWSMHRSHPPTKFTWFAEGTTHQWIKGDFAQ